MKTKVLLQKKLVQEQKNLSIKKKKWFLGDTRNEEAKRNLPKEIRQET